MSSLSIEDGVRLTGGGGPAHKDQCCPGLSKKVCKILLGLFALVVFFIGFGIGFACVPCDACDTHEPVRSRARTRRRVPRANALAPRVLNARCSLRPAWGTKTRAQPRF
jgi:hypothetical protein